MPFSVSYSGSKYMHRRGQARVSGTVEISDDQVYAWHAQLEAAKQERLEAQIAAMPSECGECGEMKAKSGDYMCADCRVRIDQEMAEEEERLRWDQIREASMQKGYNDAIRS